MDGPLGMTRVIHFPTDRLLLPAVETKARGNIAVGRMEPALRNDALIVYNCR